MGLLSKAASIITSPGKMVSDASPYGLMSGALGGSAMDLIPGIGDARAQERANAANIQQAEINRQFQERMSSTAYQRAMADMRSAGLNPTLAYIQGGASAPSGSTAQVESASKTGLADFGLKALTGVGGLQNQATALRQQQSMNESTIQLNASTAAKNIADAERIREDTKGMGRKAEEGSLWKRFYKGINGLLDSTAKHAKEKEKQEGPLIKSLGPADKRESSRMFKWLVKP